MATNISGTITTGAVTTAESWSHVPEIAKLALMEPDQARLAVLYFKMKRKVRRVHNAEYDVQERRPRTRYTTVTGAHNDSVTTITVGTTVFFTKGDYAICPSTGETFHVAAVASGTTLTVAARGTVGGAAVALVGGEYFVRIARHMGEAFTAGTSFITGTDKVTNYAGIISTPIQWSKTQLKTWSQLSDNQMSARKEADREAMSIEHIRELDYDLLLSKKASYTDVDGNLCRFTNGAFSVISTNKYTHTSAQPVTEETFSQYVIQPAFKNGSPVDKWGITSIKFLGTMEQWGKDRLRPNDNLSQKLGFEVMEYRNSVGKVNIIHHPGLDVPYYEDSFGLLDLRWTGIALLRDTELQEGIQNPKDDVVLDQWLTEAGFSYQYEETCALGLKLHGA